MLGITLVLVACNTTTSTLLTTYSDSQTSTSTTTESTTTTTTTTTTVDELDYQAIDVSATSTNNTLRMSDLSDSVTPWNPDLNETTNVTINDFVEYQAFYGTGAALTYSAAYVIDRSPDRDAIIEYLFGEDGLNIQLVRLAVGASDFVPASVGHYTYDDTLNNAADVDLNHFSIEKDRIILSILQDALLINPNITFIAAPWSAPAWMKDNKSLYMGSLQVMYYDDYARYLVRYVEEMRNNGIEIHYLSIQNEPFYASSSYPGMYWSLETTREFLNNHLGPALQTAGWGTKIMIWDHNPVDNSGEFETFPTRLLNNTTAKTYIDAIGVHCYTGNETDMQEYLDMLHENDPDIEVFMTECTAITTYKAIESNMEWSIRRMYTSAYNRFAVGTTYWNMALDPNGTTHLGGCSNCTGLISVPLSGSGFTTEADGYVTGQFNRYFEVGMNRIAVNSSTTSLLVTGFKSDGGRITIVLFNDGSARNTVCRWRNSRFKLQLPANSLTTVSWQIPQA